MADDIAQICAGIACCAALVLDDVGLICASVACCAALVLDDIDPICASVDWLLRGIAPAAVNSNNTLSIDRKIGREGFIMLNIGAIVL